MSRHLWSFLTLAGLAAATAAFIHHQVAATTALRAEAARGQDLVADLERLRAEERELSSARVSGAVLEELRADHAALARLRNEIEATRRRVEAAGRSKGTASAAPESAARPTLHDRRLAASEWTNAGRASPASALETALWAAASGEVDELAATLALDSGARERAGAILDSLPSTARRQYGTPERLVALLTAREIPLGDARILAETPTEAGSTLLVQMRDAAGGGRTMTLALTTDGDAWRLHVPEKAVERFGAALAAPPSVGGAP